LTTGFQDGDLDTAIELLRADATESLINGNSAKESEVIRRNGAHDGTV
jgi:hypothetical protein